MSNDDFTFRSRRTRRAAGSRRTSRRRSAVRVEHDVEAKELEALRVVRVLSAAGTNARVPGSIAGSTLITVFSARRLRAPPPRARARPSRAPPAGRALVDRALPERAASSETAIARTYCCECLLRLEFVQCMRLRRGRPPSSLAAGLRTAALARPRALRAAGLAVRRTRDRSGGSLSDSALSPRGRTQVDHRARERRRRA